MNQQNKILVGASSGIKFTESPRWRGDKMWFLDIHDNSIKTADMSGSVSTQVKLPFIPNSFGFMADGAILVGDAFKRTIHRSVRGDIQPFADISALTKFCLSDGITDSKGGMYVGDIGYNFLDPAQKPVNSCVIVRVSPEGQSAVVAKDLAFPNGMVITPDNKTLIVAETLNNCLTAFDIIPDGSLSGRRVWAQLPKDVGPDGICLDSAGGIWCANPEGKDSVVRIVEGGTITDRIQLPTHAYAVMLGGPERKFLFICTSDTHDPEKIRANCTAALRTIRVEEAGAGIP
jgi:sugar lactone lactonase YvrE